MALKINRPAAATLVAAAFSMLATPAVAAELPRHSAPVHHADAEQVQQHRGGGWGGWRGYHRRDRVDVGDVIAGVLVLGTIAAIADAVKDRQRERDPYPRDSYPHDEDGRYRTPGRYQGSEGRGMDRAVDMCVAEVERNGARIDSIDAANRDAEGWRVAGELENGSAFNCRIDNSGRISEIGGSGVSAAEPVADGQWSDEDYYQARGDLATQSASQDAEGGYAEDDGRYETARAPDFQ